MRTTPQFSVEIIDGCRLGRLDVPYPCVADWLNFLAAPQYRAELISAEQGQESIHLYFQASEGVYLYLDMRLKPLMESVLAS